jgi:outer membrane protein assembly factor BamD
MIRKLIISVALSSALLVVSGCHHKVQNPLANVDSKQPDKALFDKSMDAIKHGRYQEARTLLETLINTYPDSEFIARAKLALGDAWYAEGGTAAWTQADIEYKDFITFFPNLPEAAEAQLKIASMHYRQMEKPDRDFAQAGRAAEEYKNLIQNFPDSSLVPEAKQKLREVQEVLAERQYRIAHFYDLRQNLAASQARLQSLVASYPLYSGVDEALFELGSIFEREADSVRRQKGLPDAAKERLTANFEKQAIESYSRIIKRYPAMNRAGDARGRLEALKAPVPTPTAEAIAQSKSEEQSRAKVTMSQKMMGDFKKHPNVARTSKVGEPNLSEEEVRSAAALVKDYTNLVAGTPSTGVGIEAVGTGSGTTPGANQPAPSSQNGDQGTTPPPAPAQVNEVKSGTASDGSATPAGQSPADAKQDSTSKKKGKKGLRKLVPF